MKYRNRLKEVEAVQWQVDNVDEVERLTGLNIDREFLTLGAQYHILHIDSYRPGETERVWNGDYIIKTSNDLLVCKKEIFEELWEVKR